MNRGRKDREAILRYNSGSFGMPDRREPHAGEIPVVAARVCPAGGAARTREVFDLFRGGNQEIG